jgi:hypothetical protein
MMLTLHEFTAERAEQAARMLCAEDRAELSAARIADPVRMLSEAVPSCAWVHEARWNGEPVAVFGVRPMADDASVGVPWMLTTQRMDMADPSAIAHEARRAVRRMRREYRLLVNWVHWRNARAVRFIEALGFVVEHDSSCGPGGEFRHFWWRRGGS